MAAAVVELDSLPDAIRSAAQNDDFLLCRRLGLVFGFVGRVQIRREALKLRGAGIHVLVYGGKAMLLSQMPDLLSRSLIIAQPPGFSQAGI